MLLAIILADNTRTIRGQPPYLLPLGRETVIERAAAGVLRGPFGGVIIASAPQFAPRIREQLQGYAAQHVQLKGLGKGPHAALTESIAFAEAFRQRWEKARAAAAARFTDDGNDGDDGDDDLDGEDDVAPASPAKKQAPRPRGKPGGDWSSHRKSADVKIRGLARSFDRDGIMIFRGDCPALSAELQARVVEAFGREGVEKGAQARGIAQAVCAGQRGYPVALTLDAAREVAALPPTACFDDWLLENLRRAQDVKTDDPAAVSGARSEAGYQELLSRLKI
jgi:CTP:molybdopterin cytidylyltransferase MocA